MTASPSDNLDHDAGLSPDEQEMEALRMSFGDHLEELRRRLIYALLGAAAVFLVTLYYGSPIVVWLLRPLVDAQRQAGVPPVTVAGITSGFTTYIVVAAVSALIIASPWVLYQLWQFVAAGLYPSERKMIVMLAPLSGLMSFLGVCFLYYIMLPVGLFFFLSFTASYPQVPASHDSAYARATQWVNRIAVKLSGVPGMSGGGSSGAASSDDADDAEKSATPDSRDAATPADADGASAQREGAAAVVTIPLVLQDPVEPVQGQIWLKEPEGEVRLMYNNQVRTLSMTAASLIMPLVQVSEYLKFVAFLALGVVVAFQTPVVMLILSWAGLFEASSFKRFRKHVILICFIVAAVLTPPDPVTMTMLAVPMYLLFELGLLLMSAAERAGGRRRLPDPSDDAEENAPA